MIKIMIDSASDIDQTEAREKGVILLPMQVAFGEQTYSDGVDLSHREFFEKLIEGSELPKTSQINEYQFAEAFEKATADGSDVIVITISSALSGTFDSADRAAKKFAGRVHAVDSLNACIGERILCDHALELVRAGKSAAEIAQRLNAVKTDIQLLAVLDTLEYLRRGGRISAIAAAAGALFSIKPVISIVGGEVKVVGKAMGSKKSCNLLTQLVDKCGGINFDMPYATAYSGLDDTVLKKYLNDSERLWRGKTDSVPMHMIGSTIGTHAGPGAIAVAFFANRSAN